MKLLRSSAQPMRSGGRKSSSSNRLRWYPNRWLFNNQALPRTIQRTGATEGSRDFPSIISTGFPLHLCPIERCGMWEAELASL